MLLGRLYRWHLGLALFLGLAGMGVFYFLSGPLAYSACSALPSTDGTATFAINAPSTGTYRFWTHLYSPSANNNGVYLQIDNSYCQIKVGDSAAIPAGQFTWVDYQSGLASNKITVSLTAGNHAITMAGLDPGVGVDRVMVLSDTNCVPTGAGDNCVTSGSPAPTPSQSPVMTVPVGGGSTSTVSGTVSLPKPSQPGVTRTYYLDGKKIDGSKLDTTKLADGTHDLKVVDQGPDGKTKTVNQKLVIKNTKGVSAQVLGWLSQPLHVAIAVAAALAVLGSGGFAVWRFNLMPRVARRLHAALFRVPAVMHAANISDDAPPAQVVYPDKPGSGQRNQPHV